MTTPATIVSTAGEEANDTKLWAIIVIACAAVASGVAAYLLHGFLLKTYGTEAFDSACAINETFNCDKINTSVWGKLFGIPITVFAIPTYVAFLGLGVVALGKGTSVRAAWTLLRLGSAVGLAYGAFLLYVMVAIEQTYCLFCLTMDGMGLAILVSSSIALRRLGAGGASYGRPLAIALAAGLLTLGAAWSFHESTRQSLLSEQIAAADKAAADADAARAAHAAQVAEASAGDAAVTATAGATGAQVARKISDSLYEVPVHPDDAVLGPADAKVTIIEFADFQCGYCKKLFYVMQNLKRRYEGKVRFVFKHFPMNTLCNEHIKNNRHKYACNAALAAECARRQGKFWAMHDMLFKNQHKLEGDDLRFYARSVGLDMDTYASCMRDPAPRESLKRSIDEGGKQLELSATPRTFLNGLLLSGALPEELLSRMIDKELEKAGATPLVAAAAEAPAAVVAPGTTPMVQIHTAKGGFWIDRYEAAIDAQGRALSLPSVEPANASWYEANEACNKAGKRMCTSFEWVSACAGKDAVDDDNNNNFADDYVEGNQFPYADYHEPGYCHVDGDRREGRPQATGSSQRCVTPTGVFDLAGNVEEWIEATEEAAQLAGGDFRAGDKASCVRAHRSFGPGHRSYGIGFRCCADREVANASAAPTPHKVPESVIGEKAPAVDLARGDGRPLSLREYQGKVVFVTFFASWCSPCRRELPELAQMQQQLGAKGLQILAIGVDTEEADGRAFVSTLGSLDIEVVYDPQSKTLGRYDVANMPTGYLIDRKGVIRYKSVGFGETTRKELEDEIAKLLTEK